MANVSRVNGFRPLRYNGGAEWSGQMNLYQIPASDATATFKGDVVRVDGTASLDGFATVKQHAAGVATGFVGVVTGFAVNPLNLNIDGSYRLASTLRYVYVADDPNLLFEVQANGVMGQVDVGQNIDIVVGAGSTTTGFSGMQIDTATKNTTATLPFKIVGFSSRPDNDIASTNAKWIVAANNHSYKGGTGTIGF